MSKIHFVGGEKGGVGKSCVARLLAQYLIDHQIAFTVCDGDQSHAEMVRFYADYSQAVNLADGDEADSIFEAALEDDQQVVVDLPSQSERLLARWMDESGLLELADKEGVPLVFWHVMDDGKNSIDLLQRLLETLEPRPNLHIVAVKNLGRGVDFSYFDESETAKLALERGVRILTLPQLNPKVMNKIDRLNLSFWAATHLDQKAGLGKLERQRARVWLQRFYQQLDDRVGDLVGQSNKRQQAEVFQIQDQESA
jgi:hypothetical protein